MIIIAGEDRAYFATSIALYASFSPSKNIFEAEDLEIWHKDGMLVAVDSGYSRVVDLIRYEVELPKELTIKELSSYYERIVSVLEDNYYVPQKGNFPFFVFIADNTKIYSIAGAGTISEEKSSRTPINAIIDPLTAEMAIEDHAPANLSAIDKIKYVYKKKQELSMEKLFPVIVLNSKDDSVTILEEDF